jgi:hypothetical protein
MNEESKAKDNRTMIVRKDEVDTGLSAINLLDEKGLAQAEFFLKKILTSDKSGLKSVQDGLAIMMRAKDLNLPFSTCIEHIHVINGKTGVDVHIVKALLLRAGIVWNCTKDYVPQYQYTDGNTIYLETQLPDYVVKCRNAKEAEEKTNDDVVGVYPLKYYADLKGNKYNEFEISSKCVKCINKLQAMKVASEGQFPVIRIAAQPIDYVTEYEFTRFKSINGITIEMKVKGHFSYSEALVAGLFEKDTYKKYARILIGHRAFAYGARDIASDYLMGVMTDDEIAEVVGNTNLDTDDFINVEPIEGSNQD